VKPVPEEEAANLDEVVAAIDGLKPAEWLRLRKFASLRMAGLSDGRRQGEDLLQEAFTRTASGALRADGQDGDTGLGADGPSEKPKRARRWRRSVPFVHHLLGVMRSTSTAWRDAANPAVVVSLSAVPLADGSALDLQEGAPDSRRRLVAAELLASIRREFEGDDVVLAVIDGLASGMSQPEIADDMGVHLLVVTSALKKLRRHVKELYGKGCPC
jgi:hypothetical protein